MSAGAFLPPSQCELRKVCQVQFEIFKEQQIKAHAACVVETSRTFVNGVPVRGGLCDARMGTTDFGYRCETCNGDHKSCPGHFGMIELAEPMFNIGVFDLVLQVLKCVCKSCGALLADRSSAEFKAAQAKTGIHRLREMVKLKKSRCHEDVDEQTGAKRGCDALQPTMSRFLGIYPGLVVKCTYEDQEQRWYADRVREVFEKITDADALAMGFTAERCHPRDLLLTVLPVPPPHVRPSVAFGSQKSDNELTHKLNSIIRENTELRKLRANNVDRTSLENVRKRLQEHIGTYFHNGSTYYVPSKLSDTAQLKSLTERLKGKYGRLRGNLMGKRVDFSARTVITGDPNIDVDEVGVPFSVAMTLTFPERVNHINRKRLTEFVRRTTYPSANYVFHPNGQVLKLGLVRDRSTVNLMVGDVVERHVINGDVVLFNRQPTLHRMSMMGHRVRVLHYNTFRLNLSCTTPYNADFDGDEMNLHVPQSLLNKAELMEMMMVPKNFVSPNKSAPCMGIVQDSLLGCFRLTDKETFLDKYFVQSVAMWIDVWDLPIPAILKPRPLWTGKQIFSLILPEVNIHNDEDKVFSHNDKMLLIRRGELLAGPIKKGIVGAAAGSLIHVIFNEKGSDEVARFINGVQRVTAFFLMNFSFSVGVQDTVADRATLLHINEVLIKAREEVRGIGACANNGKLQRKAGMTLLESFEKDVNTALNKCRDDSAKKALSNVRRTNSFKCMIEAGSKGSDLNIQQIAVFVGQQNVNGKRIPFGFRRRTLPHFCLDDYGESSRGMATRGYVEGLRPHEFYFHTMAGREGLIDTAVKTADTGYLQRKLIKALEDVHAAYDGTVRNANNDVIQFIYGEDGLDGARIEGSQAFPLPMMSNDDLKRTYRYEYAEDGSWTDQVGGVYMDHNVKKLLRSDADNLRLLEAEFQQLREDRQECRQLMELTSEKLKINLPVNVERLIRNARSTMGTRARISDLSPISVIDGLQKLEQDLRQLFPSYHKGAGQTFLTEHSRQRVESALHLFTIHLRQMLASKRVIKDYKLNSKAFQFLMSEIRAKYLQSIIHPGEMIGAMAAQSCGEPATQMTLNTFHNAGISAKNVTLGVPRLLELLNVSKNQRNTSMLITLLPPHNDHTAARKAQHRIEYCTLENLVTRIQILYDPDVLNTNVSEDADFVQFELDCNHERDKHIEDSRKGSPWVLRFELDPAVFFDKAMDTGEIREAIRAKFPDFLFESTASNDDRETQIIRLRPRKNEGADSVPSLKATIPRILSQIYLRGIKGVTKAILKDVETFEPDPDTGKMAKHKVWAIDTEGTALKQVFIGLLDPSGNNIIDFTRTSSNKIPEVNQLLGIEAARYKLYLEMREVYGLYSVAINYRHYMVLVDTMCQRGYLMAVSRVGINRSDAAAGPLMRCSFEETVKVLMGAAAFGERDNVRGVSANIMLGNQARIGTGLFDLMLDLSSLRDAVSQEDATAPGRDPNVYHTMQSVQQGLSSVYPGGVVGGAGGGAVAGTPRATDPSVLFPQHTTASSSSAPYHHGAFGTSPYVALQGSPVHASQLPPGVAPSFGAAAGGGSVPHHSAGHRAEDFSNASMARSSASMYQALNSAEIGAMMRPHLLDSPAYSDASFLMQSVGQARPFDDVSIASLHSSPTYGVMSAQSPMYSAGGAGGGAGAASSAMRHQPLSASYVASRASPVYDTQASASGRYGMASDVQQQQQHSAMYSSAAYTVHSEDYQPITSTSSQQRQQQHPPPPSDGHDEYELEDYNV